MARNAEKVAISLERDLLERAERLRRTTGESRSALLGRALRDLLRAEARAQRIDEYISAYRRLPETATEVTRARKLARRSVAELPWDDA